MQIHGGVMSYRQNHLDLDPTYRDIYGNPLMRLTFDFQKNDLDMEKYVTDRAVEIAKAVKGNRGYNVRRARPATTASSNTRPRTTPAAPSSATIRRTA